MGFNKLRTTGARQPDIKKKTQKYITITPEKTSQTAPEPPRISEYEKISIPYIYRDKQLISTVFNKETNIHEQIFESSLDAAGNVERPFFSYIILNSGYQPKHEHTTSFLYKINKINDSIIVKDFFVFWRRSNTLLRDYNTRKPILDASGNKQFKSKFPEGNYIYMDLPAKINGIENSKMIDVDIDNLQNFCPPNQIKKLNKLLSYVKAQNIKSNIISEPIIENYHNLLMEISDIITTHPIYQQFNGRDIFYTGGGLSFLGTFDNDKLTQLFGSDEFNFLNADKGKDRETLIKALESNVKWLNPHEKQKKLSIKISKDELSLISPIPKTCPTIKLKISGDEIIVDLTHGNKISWEYNPSDHKVTIPSQICTSNRQFQAQRLGGSPNIKKIHGFTVSKLSGKSINAGGQTFKAGEMVLFKHSNPAFFKITGDTKKYLIDYGKSLYIHSITKNDLTDKENFMIFIKRQEKQREKVMNNL